MGVCNKTILWVLMLWWPLLGVAQSGSTAYDLMLKGLYSHTVETLTCEQAKEWKNAIYLDSREKAEYNVSHIKGAQWVGYDTFNKERLEDLPRTDTIIVYCSVGYRSEKVGEQLKAMGFEHVYNLYGGIFQWVNEDNPVVDNNNTTTQKVHAYSKTWGVWLDKGEKVYQ